MGENKTILLALKNEEDFKEFTQYFDNKGYEYICADNGSKAMEFALDVPPKLIIVDCQLPLIEGSHLFRILRNNPHTSKVPFLFISNRALDIKDFKVGVDIFFTRPFLWDELNDQIQRSFSSAGTAGKMDDKEIQGRLSRVPLVDILQMLQISKNEGELHLSAGDLHAVIYLKDGFIYNAACGKVDKEKALFRLINWKDGLFEFHPTTLSIERRIQTGTDHLLMEAMRQLDELAHSKDKFPDIDLRIGANVDTDSLPSGLKPVMYEVMKLVIFYPRVGDIIEHCSFTDYEVYSTIANLLERDILKVTEPAPDESIPSDESIITPAQAIKIKEKIISNWSEMMLSGYGKLLILSTSPNLVKTFAYSLKFLPNFSLNSHSVIVSDDKQSANVIGEIASLKLYGNMEVTFFSTPLAGRMGPFLGSFSSNILGLIILWDSTNKDLLLRLKADKDTILSKRRVPVVHIRAGGEDVEEDVKKYNKALGVKKDENNYDLSNSDDKAIFEIFQQLLVDISGEGFVTSKVNAL
jgi:DNA-binding response OmpR family regulator/signal recognition particle receptor subunit beta